MGKGYKKLVVQIGKGTEPTGPLGVPGIIVHLYQFKPTLVEDMKQASLIISHGGRYMGWQVACVIVHNFVWTLSVRKQSSVKIGHMYVQCHQTTRVFLSHPVH